MSLRKINTFVIRDGRITQGQLKALESYYQKNTIPIDALTPQEISEHFGNENPIILEIGFGSGEHLIANAIKSPGINFIGLEVFKSGIGQVLNAIEEHNLPNIKVINHDAMELLNHHI
ncbi:MAG: tRNA (guanosine(46)-N7)-methyltransferase TrmB, partial [Alphaproteobacteria bacterium]|nr:tRNA (guanosine(46)-N7)-methyltransferase TrmB [Alphaproteobacteria bacterium]